MIIKSIKITQKKKKDYLTVDYSNDEFSKDKQQFDAKYKKISNQPMSRALSDVLDKLEPHLLYATELCSKEIILDEKLDARKWFNEFKFNEEERFQGLQITQVDFIGNNGDIDSVKLYGFRETQETDKGFKVKLETHVINLDRTAENHYKLVVILEEQIHDLYASIEAWLVHGETLSKAQQEMFVVDQAS